MSSSPTSSSSSSEARLTAGAAAETVSHPFGGLLDVICDLSVILGTGIVTVRRCLALQRNSVLRLDQSAGEDLQLKVNGITIARGEVVIVEDSTALRITEIPPPSHEER
jgi:flagellar motor switch protein FliN/FliY